MKNQPKLFMGILLLIFMASCNNNPCPEPEVDTKETIDREQLKAEIEELFVLTQRLIKEKDVKGLVNRFTANGTLKLPMSPLMQGHDALHKNYQNMVAMDDLSLHINTLEVNISDASDMAGVLGEFAVSFSTPQGPFRDSGYSLFTMVRENNQWKIAAEVLSSMPLVQ